MSVLDTVLLQQQLYKNKWQDQDDDYWLKRLMQEVSELSLTLAGDHPDTPEHELTQIASIAINWLIKRSGETNHDRLEERYDAIRQSFFERGLNPDMFGYPEIDI